MNKFKDTLMVIADVLIAVAIIFLLLIITLAFAVLIGIMTSWVLAYFGVKQGLSELLSVIAMVIAFISFGALHLKKIYVNGKRIL